MSMGRYVLLHRVYSSTIDAIHASSQLSSLIAPRATRKMPITEPPINATGRRGG